MAATMNFFRAQDEARGRTTKLVVLLVLAILMLTGSLYAIAVYAKGVLMEGGSLDWFQPELFLATSGTALVVILGTSWWRISELAKGGAFVAQSLGARPVSPHTKDLAERRYLNIVEEMSLAAGLPMPACFVVDHDSTINAFAAGNNPQDAAVAVTRGALTYLNRDELQGVIAHEFSHIGNGDMKLNLRIIGTIAGLTALAQLGYIFFRLAGSVRGKNSAPIALGMILTGVVVLLIGSGGILFAKVIQAAVSREREYLADASAVQFTRNPEGLAGALKKIAGLKGGQREASTTELESQHLFFSSTGGFMEFIFSSHPPIGDRIRRLLPTFDGVIPDVDPVGISDDSVAGLSGRQSSAAISPPIRAARAHRIPTNLEIQEAVGFQGTLPMELRASAADSIGAMAIVLGLILRQNPELRAQQLQTARGLAGGEVIAEALRLAPWLQALPAGSRLPLLDLSMPALRQLSKAQLALFRLAIQKVGFDANDGLIVLLVQASMRRYLDDVGRSGPPPLVGLSVSYALVLSAVVRTSRETAQAQQEAFALGVAELARPDLATTILPESEVDLQKVDEAMAVIAAQSVFERRRFVRACGVAMLHDDVAEAAEIEILRAVADTLGITFATGLRAA